VGREAVSPPENFWIFYIKIVSCGHWVEFYRLSMLFTRKVVLFVCQTAAFEHAEIEERQNRNKSLSKVR